MKKLILVFVTALAVISCGKEKEADRENEEPLATETKDEGFKVILDAIYEKNDTVTLQVYDVAGNEYLDKDVIKTVEGSPLAQKVEFDSPKGVDIHNIVLVFSTNKAQDSLRINGISMIKGGNEVITNENHLDYFFINDQMILNTTNGKYKLLHDKVYHPGYGGNEQMKAILDD